MISRINIQSACLLTDLKQLLHYHFTAYVSKQMVWMCRAARGRWCTSNSCAFIRSCASSAWLQFWSERSPGGSTSRACARLSSQLGWCCQLLWALAGKFQALLLIEGWSEATIIKFRNHNFFCLLMVLYSHTLPFKYFYQLKYYCYDTTTNSYYATIYIL